MGKVVRQRRKKGINKTNAACGFGFGLGLGIGIGIDIGIGLGSM